MVGIPADRLMAGAAHVARECSSASLLKNPAYIFAACQYLAATKKGKNVAVLMPYAASLRDVADWFRQLWAESLGKRVDTAGRVVHTGQTPVKALGVTDQHSQMQLYVEGPADKVVTFLHVERFRSKLSFPRGPRGYSSLNYLGGKKVADLMEAEFQGTRMALTRSQRPNMTFSIRSVTPEAVGGLFQLFELANAMSGELYGINAFDQPGVEAGKEAAYALMGRKGYDELCRSIESAMKAKALRV
jgi:glucose-6-phosphate isomerase